MASTKTKTLTRTILILRFLFPSSFDPKFDLITSNKTITIPSYENFQGVLHKKKKHQIDAFKVI